MARSKPKTLVIADPKQAESAMMELAGLARSVKAVEIDAQETIDQIKLNAKNEMEPLLGRKKDLESALCTYATLNKCELFDKRRSRSTPFGDFGWRKATKLIPMAKLKLADVLERLRELNIREAIRIKESVDKTAMVDWTDSRLEGVGMRRVTKDEFFIEIVEDNVAGDE